MPPLENTTGAAARPHDYDYIIAGGGCAGLSLAVHMIRSGSFRNKRILLVDKASKTDNDRTWCMWERSEGLFQACVLCEWQHLMFHSGGFSKKLDISPYTYKLIRGIDFYRFCIALIEAEENFTIVQGEVASVSSTREGTWAEVNGERIYCGLLFNSILFGKPVLKDDEYWLLQHFKGWVVKTARPAFDPAQATLMDFRTSQEEGASFFYVLPLSDTEALVEYTLFSPTLLDSDAYDAALGQYIRETLQVEDFTVPETEFGVIPMTNHRFSQGHHNLVNIGTAGGQTKGSSGYTFQYIQKHAAAIVNSLIRSEHPLEAAPVQQKFRFYDSVLLHILHNRSLRGADIFRDLFQRNRVARVLKFLDNETTFGEDLGIITSLPTLPFAKAALSHLLH